MAPNLQIHPSPSYFGTPNSQINFFKSPLSSRNYHFCDFLDALLQNAPRPQDDQNADPRPG